MQAKRALKHGAGLLEAQRSTGASAIAATGLVRLSANGYLSSFYWLTRFLSAARPQGAATGRENFFPIVSSSVDRGVARLLDAPAGERMRERPDASTNRRRRHGSGSTRRQSRCEARSGTRGSPLRHDAVDHAGVECSKSVSSKTSAERAFIGVPEQHPYRGFPCR